MGLTTTPEAMWVLQALTGVESLPTPLRLRPFIPSLLAHGPTAGDARAALSGTAEYGSLRAAGVIDAAGRVDPVVCDWLTVLGRCERAVVLTVRRPGPAGEETCEERTLVVARHRRWLALCARDGEEVAIAGVGEADEPGAQADLICAVILEALGAAERAEFEGFNLPRAQLQATLEQTMPLGSDAVVLALRRLGVDTAAAAVLDAAAGVTTSAMGVVSVIDYGVSVGCVPHVLTVADTPFGRVLVSMSTGGDGVEWVTVWPATPSVVGDDLHRLVSAPAMVSQ